MFLLVSLHSVHRLPNNRLPGRHSLFKNQLRKPATLRRAQHRKTVCERTTRQMRQVTVKFIDGKMRVRIARPHLELATIANPFRGKQANHQPPLRTMRYDNRELNPRFQSHRKPSLAVVLRCIHRLDNPSNPSHRKRILSAMIQVQLLRQPQTAFGTIDLLPRTPPRKGL